MDACISSFLWIWKLMLKNLTIIFDKFSTLHTPPSWVKILAMALSCQLDFVHFLVLPDAGLARGCHGLDRCLELPQVSVNKCKKNWVLVNFRIKKINSGLNLIIQLMWQATNVIDAWLIKHWWIVISAKLECLSSGNLFRFVYLRQLFTAIIIFVQ